MSRDDVTLIGHPYAPIGMGEHIRCSYRAFRGAFMRPHIIDIYGLNEPDPATLSELRPAIAHEPGKINIFHINGDEIQQALKHNPAIFSENNYNIIYPAWELARYPSEWARALERFDEIWAPSQFIQNSISLAVKRPVIHMPLACEPFLTSFLGRRYFGLPEDSYAFLFFFDLRSYATRKNPQAVIAAFRKVLEKLSGSNICLVIKLHGSAQAPDEVASLLKSITDIHSRIHLIEKEMTDNEVKNLVRCCDCFISLHRSEGYGRGLAEAMYFGKPVIGTDYSGNLDFMNNENSLLVPFDLVPVPDNGYPHWQDQVWAEPSIEVAAKYMGDLISMPDKGKILGEEASRHIRVEFSYRTIGLRYARRIAEIESNLIIGNI